MGKQGEDWELRVPAEQRWDTSVSIRVILDSFSAIVSKCPVTQIKGGCTTKEVESFGPKGTCDLIVFNIV